MIPEEVVQKRKLGRYTPSKNFSEFMKSNVEYRLYVNNSIKFLFRNLSNISDEVFLAVHYFAKNA